MKSLKDSFHLYMSVIEALVDSGGRSTLLFHFFLLVTNSKAARFNCTIVIVYNYSKGQSLFENVSTINFRFVYNMHQGWTQLTCRVIGMLNRISSAEVTLLSLDIGRNTDSAAKIAYGGKCRKCISNADNFNVITTTITTAIIKIMVN